MSGHAGWRSRASAWRGRPEAYQPAPSEAAHAWAEPMPGTLPAGELPVEGPPWRGVQWSLLLVAFLTYIWVIITYSLPIGDAAMALALVGLAMQQGSLRLPPTLLLFGAFVLWCGVGYLQTDYPGPVYQRVTDLGKLWLIMLVAVNALRTRPQIRFFIFVFLAAFALYPLRGALFNYFLGGYTVAGRALWNNIFGNPNDLAALSLLPLSMVLALFIREGRGWPKLAALAGVIMIPFLILLTQSRGGALALGAFGLLVIVGQRRRGRAAVMALLVLLVVGLTAPEGVWNRLEGLKHLGNTERLEEVDEEGSAKQRFEIWKVGMTIFRENAIVGVGFGAYSSAHAVTALRSDVPRIAHGTRDTHSTYINVLAETGIVGFALFASIFLSVAVQAERVRRRIRAVMPTTAQQLYYLELGLLAYFLAGIFGSFSKLSFPYIQAALLFSLTAAAAAELGEREARRSGAAAWRR
jgi:putative inorganic carbon (HCO3(-)) transporter